MKTSLISAAFVLWFALSAHGQTNTFRYQGSLTDAGNPAAGAFQMQFKLFDAASGGVQQGSTLTDLPVTVANGVFSVQLNFGSGVFSGADRWLEVAVRHNSGEGYVTLNPRQQVASSPYAIRTLSAAMADDSQKLGGVNASDYVTTTAGGTSFIKNQTTAQASSNFNISGDGSATRMFVGAPTALPGSAKLVVNSGGYGITHHNNTVSIQSLINSETGFIGTTSSHPFGLLSGGTERMRIDTNGNIGIGTAAPTHTLDVNGFFRAVNVAGGNVVSETTGGTNSWAKFWVRTPVQSWSIGSSHNFNGNQLYFSNETSGLIRMAIMPNGHVGIGTTAPNSGLEVAGTGSATQQRITDITSGNSLVLQGGAGSNMKVTGYNYSTNTAVPLHLSTDGANVVLNSGGGNVVQPGSSYGIPKAMLFVQANGAISRCYNGLTGVSLTGGTTNSGCGFTVNLFPANPYTINFPFNVAGRFYSLTSSSTSPALLIVGRLIMDSVTPNSITAAFWRTSDDAPLQSDFTLVIY